MVDGNTNYIVYDPLHPCDFNRILSVVLLVTLYKPWNWGCIKNTLRFMLKTAADLTAIGT